MWHFGIGYVIIQIEGLSAARLLRRMTEAGIRVRDAKRIDSVTLRCSIPVNRFFDLHRLKRGLPLRIHILERRGLRFTARKLCRRPFLWAESLILLGLLVFASSRIWVIRIDETKRVDPEEIRLLLKERGIAPGALLSGPILITAANDLSAQIYDAAWIGLDREGVLLKVNVVESIPESPKKTTRVPSDVIADRDGVITSLQVMRGQARVKVGDSVKAGDVLISGTVLRNGDSYETAADGVVKGVAEYRAEVEITDTVTESYETDREETVRVLRFASFEIARTKPSFTHYRLCETTSLAISTLLPVYIDRIHVREIGFRERALSEEEAESNALTLAREQAYALIPRDAAIINTYGTVKTVDGKRYAVVTVTAEETIGKTEEEPHDG